MCVSGMMLWILVISCSSIHELSGLQWADGLYVKTSFTHNHKQIHHELLAKSTGHRLNRLWYQPLYHKILYIKSQIHGSYLRECTVIYRRIKFLSTPPSANKVCHIIHYTHVRVISTSHFTHLTPRIYL